MALNWKGALAGGVGGAAAGAPLGGWGAIPGALLGGLAGLFSPGAKERQQQAFGQMPNRFNPEQQGALSALLKQGQAGLQNPTAGFEPFEQRARNKFTSESIPGLAERFTSMGGSGTARSSDLEGTLGGAKADFELGLEGLRQQYGQQNQQNALQMLQTGLAPQHEQIYFGQAPDVGSSLLEAGGNIFGNYAAGGGFGGNKDNDTAEAASNFFKQLNPNQQKAFAQFIQLIRSKKGAQ